jgi:hypothetical protein
MARIISLCCISGNEEPAIVGFLDSFSAAFDELCIVRAIGNQPHDKTLTLAKDWCAKNGKAFKAGEYKNATTATGFKGEGIDGYNPATWPHVDDFAAARNMAWEMATCPWQIWADIDDALAPALPGQRGGAELIRYWAERGEHDEVFFGYDLRNQSQFCMRERLFRTGVSTWVQPLHEQCRLLPERNGKPWRVLHEDRVIYEHIPQVNKSRDPMRNRRVMAYHLRYLDAFAWELHREWFYEWAFAKNPEHMEKATRWAEIAHQTKIMPQQEYDMLLHQARIASGKDVHHALDLCWSAIRIDPKDRNAWGDMAEYELMLGRGERAANATAFMQSIPKRMATGYPKSEHYYGWQGVHLRARSLRAAGQEPMALKIEDDIFAKNGQRISLLHATRGRPQQAIETRNNWFRSAFVPLGVEHIFAIDADDKESLEALKHYRHVIVEEPRGCVKAWNAAAAASSGNVLVQLSDDWIPCHDWDVAIWDALTEAIKSKYPAEGLSNHEIPVGQVPLVLAIHDGHRNDALLCMAILTRARYNQQTHIENEEQFTTAKGEPAATWQTRPHLFSPEYFGVFSDNEFTVRAYDDGVVVQAQHIVFEHAHPIWQGKPVEQWDETHRRQNAPERYREGLQIFNRRNPKHALQNAS